MLPSLLLVIAAAPATPTLSLAAPGLTLTNLKSALADPLNEHLALNLNGQGFKTVTSGDIRAVLGLERQRQLLGCSDEKGAMCLAELAGALGVDGIVQGSVTKLGKRVQLTIKIISGSDGSTLAAASESTTESELFDALTAVADRLGEALQLRLRARQEKAAALRTELPPSVPPHVETAPAPPAPRPSLASWWWAPATLGVGLGVAAGLTFGRAATLSSQLRAKDTVAITDVAAARAEGETMATLGWVFAGTAAAAGLTALGFGLFGQPLPEQARVAAWLAPGAGGLSLSWELR